MKVVIIRHAEVDFDWSRECSSKGFDSDCNGYDNAPVYNITYKIPEIGYKRVYISELSRSLNTAEKLFPDGDYTETGLINEVPLRSSYDTNRKMPLWFWNLSWLTIAINCLARSFVLLRPSTCLELLTNHWIRPDKFQNHNGIFLFVS